MSKGIPVQIGTLEFPTKKAANQFFGEILSRYHTPSAPIAQDDDAHLRSLIEYHPRRMEKGLFDVDHFTVYQTNGKPGHCFHAVKRSGPQLIIDFSFRKCVENASANPRSESPIQQLNAACRASVDQDTLSYKDDHLEELLEDGMFRCPITGNLHDPSEVVVHHAEPKFREIVDRWLVEKQCEARDIPVQNESGDTSSCVGSTLDEPYLSSFRDFHNEHAVLQLVSREGNGIAERGDNHHTRR